VRLRQTFVCHAGQTEAAESTCSYKAVLTLDALQHKVIEKTANLRGSWWAAHAGKHILDEAKARQGRLILLRQNARLLFDVVIGLGSKIGESDKGSV
jgi:serine acetyltransferase